MAEESNWKRGQRFHCTNVACVLFRSSSSRICFSFVGVRWQTRVQSRALFTHWTHCSRTGRIVHALATFFEAKMYHRVAGSTSSIRRALLDQQLLFVPACISLSPFSAVSNSSCELALAQYILTAGKAHRRLICLAGKLSILLQRTRIVLISLHGMLSAASEACLQFQPSPSFCGQGWLS